MSLGEEFKIDGAERNLRKEYGKLTAQDLADLRGLLPVMEREVDRVVREFYEHVLEFAAPREFLRDPGVLQRVKQAQREYILDLFRGEIDQRYFERRLQIGVAHERIGLPAKWYIASNSVFLQLLMPIVDRYYRFRPMRRARAQLALCKIVNLDEQLVMDTYIGSMVDKLQGLSHQIMRTVEVLAPTAHQSAEGAEAAAGAAERAVKIAEQGTSTVQQALRGMSDLKEKANAAVLQSQRLNEQVRNIENIVKLVSNLTTQTNMLALNAEVQAARAGERGRGFAVVAEEIRKLADQSAESLTRVHALVAEIRDTTRQTVMVSEENTRTAQSGTELTREIGDAFNRLAQSSKEASDSVKRISITAKDQARLLLELQREVDGRGSRSGSGDGRRP